MSQPPAASLFICRLAAGTTHEFRNVLAIIGETAGLIQDLCQADALGGSSGRDGLLKALQRIEKQVARGSELVSALNGLAHSLDQEREWLDLADQARGIAVLCRHWTNQQSRSITVAPSLGVRVNASRLLLSQLLAAAIECAVQAAPAGAEITLAAVLRADQPALSLRWAGADPGTAGLVASPEWGRLEAAAALLAAALEPIAGQEFIVLFPGTPESA